MASGKIGRDLCTFSRVWLGLADVQIECSYDSERPAALMFGHISPPGLYYELKTLASLLNTKET